MVQPHNEKPFASANTYGAGGANSALNETEVREFKQRVDRKAYKSGTT